MEEVSCRKEMVQMFWSPTYGSNVHEGPTGPLGQMVLMTVQSQVAIYLRGGVEAWLLHPQLEPSIRFTSSHRLYVAYRLC